MSSANKRKGTKFETDLLGYIRGWVSMAQTKWAVERSALTGAKDEGDLHIDFGDVVLVLEAKNAKTPEWAQWLREAEVEAANWSVARGNRDNVYGVVVRKRPRTTALDSLCVLPLHALLHMMKTLTNGTDK